MNNFSVRPQKRLLAIDCASSLLSIAVLNEDVIHYHETESEMKLSELIMGCIGSQMEKACVKAKDLDGVLCMGGPGSFTGLRIGYSIAKGLALCLSVPFAPVPTLDCITESIYNNERYPYDLENSVILSLIEAGKNAYFYAFYKNGLRLTDEKDADSIQILKETENYKENIIVAGNCACELVNRLPENPGKNNIFNNVKRGYAKEIISIAKKRNILDNDCTAYLYSGPEYIRNT
ncbi:MAG: tRNA (adenosine(37)-N6)-threonylcarbamoyltransferase complex dimerization subunit type 1 TsaB [Treponema sp.]|nr:tRNA (adenosine(37)-N6)-threonylcarbamoyltransferase complex dimerization subunit type 1 TsaB [Treponema sp.]